MIQHKAYAQGFSKAAESYGIDPEKLYGLSGFLKVAEQLQMQKRAGKFGPAARLLAKLSPKVNPDKLNWFTRLFTNSHTALAKSNPIRKGFNLHLNWGPESAGSLFSSIGFGADLPPVLRNVTRLSPLKILAGATAAGGGTAVAANALKKEKGTSIKNLDTEKNTSVVDAIKNMSPELKKKLLIGLGIGTTGLVGAGIARAALSGSTNKKNVE